MKKIIILLSLAASMMFTGCFNIVEEVFLNKNGSGKYHITMDMSGLFTDPFMKEMFGEALKQQQGTDIKNFMEKDSVIYFKNLPQSDELAADEKKIVENMLMRMTMSESKKQMLIKIEMDFETIDDIAKMSEVMQKIGADDALGGGLPTGGILSGNSGTFSWKKGLLKRLPTTINNETQTNENMEMIKMFLGTATYKTIYHLPGKVKKTDIANAQVDGNTVTIDNKMLDLIDGKAKVDGAIKFK